jgi:hypothetical protein
MIDEIENELVYIPEETYRITSDIDEANMLEEDGWNVEKVIIYICKKD